MNELSVTQNVYITTQKLAMLGIPKCNIYP